MTAPVHALCKCSHSKVRHEHADLAPQCTATACTCLQYRPDVAAPASIASPLRSVPAPVADEVPDPPREEAVLVPSPEIAAHVAQPADNSVEPRITAGRASRHKRTVALANRIADMLDDLGRRLADEQKDAKVLAEISALEAKLAAAKAKLGKPTKPAKATAATEASTGSGVVCPTCGKSFGTMQGRQTHRAVRHGYRAGDDS